MSKNLYMALFFSVCLPIVASSQIVKGMKGGQFFSDTDYGHITPCSALPFMVFDYVIPSGYAKVDRFEWYYGSTLVFTETDGDQPGTPGTITLNDRTAVVSCRIYYRTATQPYSYTFHDAQPFDPILRNTTVTLSTTTTSIVPGCSNEITFTTSTPAPSGPLPDAFFVPASYTVSYTP